MLNVWLGQVYGEFRRRVKTQGSSLILMKLRRIDGWRKIAAA
jgi:hypothetical protein